MKYKIGQRVFTICELDPYGLGGLSVSAFKITRVINDKSEDLLNGDYVVKSLDKNDPSRQFYSEVDLLDRNEILEKVEEITQRKFN